MSARRAVIAVERGQERRLGRRRLPRPPEELEGGIVEPRLPHLPAVQLSWRCCTEPSSRAIYPVTVTGKLARET